MFCNEKGYDVGSYDMTQGYGDCMSYSTINGWTISTAGYGSIRCSYNSMGTTYYAAFTTPDNVMHKYGCARDGVCADDFSALPSLCGFEPSGLHTDPDCGQHIWMKGGRSQVTTESVHSVDTFSQTPSTFIHRECVNNNSCVYNTTTSGYQCYNTDAVYNTRLRVTTDLTNTTTKLIVCSGNNTWCPKYYEWDQASNTCEFTGSLCSRDYCPEVTNFAVYDGIGTVNVTLINNTYILYNHSLDNVKTVTGQTVHLTQEQIVAFETSFLNNHWCVQRDDTKIVGVCAVLTTFPEMKYEYKNVTVN